MVFDRLPSLSILRHTAYDRNLSGIAPDGRIVIAESVLEQHDGPALEAGRTLGTGVLYVKFRSAMLRNSREKSSISAASALVVLVKWL